MEFLQNFFLFIYKMENKEGRSTFLRIRVDEKQDSYKLFKEFLESKGMKIVAACREAPSDENPHFHALVEGKCSLEALRTARKRYFKDNDDMKGNGVASMSKCDQYEEYLEYLCKGEDAIKDKKTLIYKKGKKGPNIVENLLNLNVMKYFKAFWNRHKEDKPRKPKDYHSRESFSTIIIKDWCEFHGIDVATGEEISIEVEDEFKEKEIKILEHKQLGVAEDVVDWLIDYLGKYNKPWDDYIIIRYANLIHWKYKQHFKSHTFARVSQRNSILAKMGVTDLM